MNVSLLIFLGLCGTILARDCLHPIVQNDFNKKNFEGQWYALAFNTPNVTENSLYQTTRCSYSSFEMKNDSTFTGDVNYYLGDINIKYSGLYTVLDPSKANLKVEFGGYPLVYAYDITCTDYNHFAVIYSCSQIEPGHSSEFITLFGRDRTSHSQAITNEVAKKCVQDNFQMTIDSLKKIPQESC